MPPKPKNPKAPEEQFLFVNQDASSLLSNRKDAQLNQSKQRHVQRQYFARKKAGAQQVHERTKGSPTHQQPSWLGGTVSPGATRPRETLVNRSLSQDVHMTGDVSSGFGPGSQHNHSYSPSPNQSRSASVSTSSSANLLQEQFSLQSSSTASPLPSSEDRESLLFPDFEDEFWREFITFDNTPSEDGRFSALFQSQPSIDAASAIPVAPSVETGGAALQTATQPTLLPRPHQGNGIDPFTSETPELHPCASQMLQYYANSIIPSMFRVETRANTSASQSSVPRHLNAFQGDIRACLTNETHMYTPLASRAVRMRCFEGRSLLPDNSVGEDERLPLYFKTKAIESLRNELATGDINHETLKVVFKLMASEMFRGNEQAVKMHFDAMCIIIRCLGGFETVDASTREKIIQTDIYGAIQTLSSPVLPLTYDPGDLPATTAMKLLPQTSPTNAGGRLRNEQLLREFHPDMRHIIMNIGGVVDLAVHSFSHADLSNEDFSWLTLRRSAIHHRLLSFPSTHVQPGDHNFIQECTRIALILWIAWTVADPVHVKALPRATVHLKHTLERSGLQSLWYPRSDLLLWILTVGAFTTTNEEDWSWFAVKAAKVANYLQVTDEAEIKDVLQGFLYIDEVQHDAVSNFVNKLRTLLNASNTEVRYYDANSLQVSPGQSAPQAS